ncbi:MAG: hypothetical protein ACJ74Y_11220 [Bryobacteraceae bacterium]
MKTFTRRLLLSTLLLASAVASIAETRTDPFVGKWVRNTEQSKYSPGPGPQSQIVTITTDEVVIEGVNPAGKPLKWSYKKSEAADPVEGADGTVSSKTSGNTVDHVWKIAGGNTRGHGVISKDGKTMTYKQDGKDGQGHTIHNVIIFDKP